MALRRVGITECTDESKNYEYPNHPNNLQKQNTYYKPHHFGSFRMECSNMRCLNGGTCVEERDKARCICTEMFGGDICEYKSRSWKYKQSYGKFI